ncbi:E3 ubiquitin-protein ligase DCST1 [Antennarius striatus]|uniref:E3 ubiquitin-protein ligase DCST1 n=1 Tax=Antennarius striatus TaxID=241820 RepID=UPI0035B382B1
MSSSTSLSTSSSSSSTVWPSLLRWFKGAAHLILRAGLGAVGGAVLFLGVAHSLPLTFDLLLVSGGVFVGGCVLVGSASSSARCLLLLMLPSILGSRGRAYLMLLTLSVLVRGPVSNIQHNVGTAAESLGCNLDLQVRNAKLLWRDAIRPVQLITQELMDNEGEFQSEALNVSRNFQNIRDDILRRYGYDNLEAEQPSAAGRSTQQQFAAKTMMQCNHVVDAGVQRCVDWFQQKWEECMAAIAVPVINHIFCVSMKFYFLCDIMRVMTPWCREQVPVEGNFGQLFDQLNVSVDLLSREFSTRLDVQEQQQTVFQGSLRDHAFSRAVRASLRRLVDGTQRAVGVLQLLLSLAFITIFIQALAYLLRYRRDIRFDNFYVTAHFRQIDGRLRRAGKPRLLPLSQSEKKKLIDPWGLRIHPEELANVTSGVFQLLSLTLLTVVLLTLDFSLFHVLDIVSRHTFTQFNVTSHHHVEIKVGGASMMARLLRKTVSGFNSASELDVHSDNRECVIPPAPLSVGVYISCLGVILLVALFSCVQVYANRLRRTIAASYHPEREEKRVCFLYNLHLQRRNSTFDRKRITSAGGRSCMVSDSVSKYVISWTPDLLMLAPPPQACDWFRKCGCGLCGCQKQEEAVEEGGATGVPQAP